MKKTNFLLFITTVLVMSSCEIEKNSIPSNEKTILANDKAFLDDEIRKKGLSPQFTINEPTKVYDPKIQISGENSKNTNGWTKITREHLKSMKARGGYDFDRHWLLRERFKELFDKGMGGYSLGWKVVNAVYLNNKDLAYPWISSDNRTGANNAHLFSDFSVEIRQNVERTNKTFNENGGLQALLPHFSGWTVDTSFSPISYPNIGNDVQEIGGFDSESWRKEISTSLGWHVTAGISATIGGKTGLFGIVEGHFSVSVSLEAGVNGSTTNTTAQNFHLPKVSLNPNQMVTYYVMKRSAPINVEYLVTSEFRGIVMADNGKGHKAALGASDFFYDYHKSTNPVKIKVSYPVVQYMVYYNVSTRW